MANEKFSTEITEILSTVFNCGPGMIAQTLLDYSELRKNIADAPEIDALTPADTHGVFSIHNYDHENKETWKDFVARVTKVEVTRDENSDPFLPNWVTKTDDRPTPWLGDTGPMIATAYKEALNRVLRGATPRSGTMGQRELIGIAPTEDDNTLIDVIQSLEYTSTLLIEGLGESMDDNMQQFRWSRALVLLAGLGFTALRHFAEHMVEFESDWDYWVNCTDDELREGILEARRICCYPISLLRADYRDLQTVCVEGALSPRWIKASLATHIFKHVRYFPNYKGSPALWMAYRSEYAHVTFAPEGVDQTLADMVNQGLRASLCRHLGIRQARGVSRIDIDDLIDDVLAKIHPRDFAKPRDLKDAPYLVVPRSVKITPSHELRSDFKWVNPGIMVSNIAKIDLDTGKVSKSTVTGPLAMSMAWPRGEMSVAEDKTWWANLPKVVKPMLPSEILPQLFRNINTLGHPEGYWALIDAAMVADLARDELAGTAIGNAMINEYPILAVFPTGHTKETTTKQGKTNFARTLANAVVQGLPVTHAGKTPSAPSQRAAASPIEEYGTALYDEFTLPESHEHFLAQAGLQSLATGGTSTPGRAGENSRGMTLKHPLFLTCKVSAFPPDIRNRTISTFMDMLTPETRCTPEELALIMSGVVANVMRLSTLMWIHKTNFIAEASKVKLIQGELRFDGHLTLARLLTKSKTLTDINAYLLAAEQQCNDQQLAADDSGLSDNIGLHSQFDGVWFFKNCSEYTLKQLSEQTEQDQVYCLPAMRTLIEDAGVRRFNDVVRQYGGKERALVLRFSDAVKEGRMTRPDGWYMEWITKGGGKTVSAKGIRESERARECIVLRNVKAIEKTNPAVPEKSP